MKKLLFPKAAMNLLSKILMFLFLSLIIISCERETIIDPGDDGLGPAVPANFGIFGARDGEVGIEWILNSDARDRYIIYRSINNQNNFIQIDSTYEEFYVDDSLDYDTTYFYRITARDIFNRESLPTKIVSAQPKNVQAPRAPLSIDINARNWNNSVYIYLNWYSSVSTDVLGYEIYRDTFENFSVDSTKLIGFTNSLFYIDASNLELLQTYYYKIKAVDKGELKSNPSFEVQDYILNSPEIIFPLNNSETSHFNDVQFKTSSKPANYKIVFQTNEFFGTVHEVNFYTDKTDQIISVPVVSLELFTPFKKYYWRVLTYSVNSTDPNSFTDLYSFTIKTQ